MSDSKATPIDTPSSASLWAQAVAGDADSLSHLAGRFWYPVYIWLRVSGNESAEVAVQTVNFFTHLYADTRPREDEEVTRRFREFLLARLKDFAAQGFPDAQGIAPIAMDVSWAEHRFAQEPSRSEDEMFGRRWALTILEATLDSLKRQFVRTKRTDLFDALKPFLGFVKSDDGGYTAAASALGISASSFHMQVFEFRKQYRAVLRQLVGDTVRHADDVDSELTVLLVSAS